MERPHTPNLPGLEIERELGRGAYGIVYLARDVLLNRQVALKVLPSSGDPHSEEARDSVLAEARLVARLSSPHVVTLYRVHADRGAWILEMEYVGGGTLEERVRPPARLPADELVRVVSGVARGLAAAHAARIVHGDVKPANVLFSDEGTPKLADFGIARMLESSRAASRNPNGIAGTPRYMAPEVVRWQGARLASDIWSLGVLAYEALSGRLPFEAESYLELFRLIREGDPPPLPDDAPPRLAQLILQCLRKEPERRPASADEIVRQLRGLSASDARFSTAVAPPPTPTNLVTPPTTFVGRRAELASVGRMLEEPGVRLVTLVGPGGVGKTRFAQEVAAAAAGGKHPGGIWFADASESRDADGVAQAVLLALGLREPAAVPPVRRVAEVLQSRPPMLVVLDNFEQVAEHALETVGAWMRESATTSFLVTSRSVLGLAGERAVELEPLSAPRAGEETAAEAELRSFDAVRLFLDRAREARPDFAPDAPVLRCVARICAELDGLPLAIELAAARVRMMSPEQIEGNLARKFQLLATSKKGTAQRQSTLKGAIEWSFGLLSGWERDAFLQACCFAEGFSLEAAERVIDLSAHEGAPFAFDVVQALRDRSLLFARDAGHETRLGMYRAIREFGEHRWRETAPEAARRALADRHAHYFLAFAESWNAGSGGARTPDALERVGLELGNLRAAHRHALESGDIDTSARLALAAAETMSVRRPPRELLEVTDATLERLDPAPSAMRARLLVHRSGAAERSGDWARATADADAALAAARSTGDARTLGAALVQAGAMRRNRGDLPGALACWEEAERVAGAAGDRQTLAAATGDRGMVHAQQGESERAEACYVTAERIAREMGDLQTAALHVCNRGVVHERHGDRFRAVACYREAEDLARRIGDRLRVAVALGNQANVLAVHGDWEGALPCYREAEAIARELGARQRIAQIVGNRGVFHANRGETEEAERCLAESEAIARALGDRQRVAAALRSRANLLAVRRQYGPAIECLDESAGIAAEIGDRALQSSVAGIRGWLLMETGALEPARDTLRSALDLRAEDGGTRSPWYFKHLAMLAQVEERLGDREAARRLGAEGLKIASALGVDVSSADDRAREAYATCRRLALGEPPAAAAS